MSKQLKLHDFIQEQLEKMDYKTTEDLYGINAEDNEVEAAMRINMCRAHDGGFAAGQARIMGILKALDLTIEVTEKE